MAILDQYGKPVQSQPAKLTQELSAGGVTSVRNPFDPVVAIGLTPKKLQRVLRSAAEGDHDEYLAFCAEMERRDGHYFSQLQTRKLATARLEFCVKPVSDSEKDKSIAKEVERFIKGEAFGLAAIDILDALGKGFSVTEIIWQKSATRWVPKAFKHRNPRWFQFDTETAEELRLYDGSANGQELLPYKYIQHRPKIFSGLAMAGGLARIVAALHLFKGFAIKDWMAFAEVFGMPLRIGQYDVGASDADKDALRAAVRDIGSDAAAIIPKTMTITFERAAQSGFAGSDRFFLELIEWCNSEVSKAVVGQTMTSDDGSSLSQAKVHNEVRKDIRDADAWQFGCTVNRDLVAPFCMLNFGEQEEYPYFYPDTDDEPEDLEGLAKALVPFIDRGLPVSIVSILEKFGLRMPEDDEELLAPMVKEAPTDEDGDEKGDKKKDKEKAAAALHEVLKTIRGATNLRVAKAKLREMGL